MRVRSFYHWYAWVFIAVLCSHRWKFFVGLGAYWNDHVFIKNCTNKSSRFYSYSDIDIIIKVKLVQEITREYVELFQAFFVLKVCGN